VAETRPKAGPFITLLVIIAALMIGGYFLWTADTRRGARHPEYSVLRTDDRGAAIAYRLYQSAGLKPQVWDRDLTALKEPGMLILLAPQRAGGNWGMGREGDILPPEIEALDRWVRAGNVVVVMTRDDNDLYAALGIWVDDPKGTLGDAAVPTQPSVLARGVESIQTQTQFGFKFGRKPNAIAEALKVEEQPSPVGTIPREQWVTLFAKKPAGSPVPQVMTAARGKGLYVVVNDVFPASNLGVTLGDDAQFMLNLARLRPARGTVWFDEYHKRNVDRTFVAYLRERSLGPAIIYALVLLGLLFWRTGVTFGAPEPLVADRRRDSGEYVRAVAALYQNAGMAREALSTVYSDFRQRLKGALRMDGLTNLEEVGRRYEARTGRPAMEAREILIQTEATLARETLNEADALQACGRLTLLDQALHQRTKETNGHRHKH
jgi:hypothetical protein